MKTKYIVLIIVGAVVIVFGTIAAIGIVAISNYSSVREQANNSLNRGNAAVICNATNTHNTLSSDDEKIMELPETKEEYDKLNTSFPLTIDEKDYQNALPWISYDDEGEFVILDELEE